MAFRVKFTQSAREDAIGILDWLTEQQAGKHGLRWFQGLKKAIASLNAMPQRCALVKSDSRVTSGVRQLFYGKKPHVFRILFRIVDDTVLILHIRRGKQSTAKLN